MAFGKLMSNYVSASAALSFAGFLNGYDTGSIGGIAHMPQFATSLGPLSASALGMTVSVIMLTGAAPALFAGRLADKRGRLGVVMPGALLFALGSLLQATSTTLGQFVAGRAVSGVGQGAFLGNVSVYIAEVAPARRRGRLAALPQFMAALGVCVGYFCCFGTAGVGGSLAWRLPYVVPVAVSLGLALVCGYLPESPRWLVTQPGRAGEARAALELLDFDMREAERDILSAPMPPQGESAGLSSRQSLALLFRRGYRSRTFLALFVLTMVQLSGIDAITYVSLPPFFPLVRVFFASSFLFSLASPFPFPGSPKLVRPVALLPGRRLLEHGLPRGLGRRLHHHARRLRPRLPPRGQVGPPVLDHIRRPRPRGAHVPRRRALRLGSRAARRRRRAVGRRRLRLPLRHGLLRDLGHRGQDLRQRDPARGHARRGQRPGHVL